MQFVPDSLLKETGSIVGGHVPLQMLLPNDDLGKYNTSIFTTKLNELKMHFKSLNYEMEPVIDNKVVSYNCNENLIVIYCDGDPINNMIRKCSFTFLMNYYDGWKKFIFFFS